MLRVALRALAATGSHPAVAGMPSAALCTPSATSRATVGPLFGGGKQQWAGSASQVTGASKAKDASERRVSSIPGRIGVLGAGTMGEALVRGFLQAKITSPGKIACSVNTLERAQALESLGIGRIFGDAVHGGAADVAAFSDIIILGVKPQAMQPVLEALAPHVTKKHLVISIAAGITLQTLEGALGEHARVVRVMPNTPALVQAGASAYSLGKQATAEDAETVHMLLSSVGFCIQVQEYQLDAVTGLSGSGPAFVYMVIEALADGGVAAGLPRDTALSLAAKTVAGAAQMVFSEDETSVGGLVHPGVLKDRVASPAGTTIAGIMELESSGVRGAFIRAVNKAAQRSKELAG